MRNENINNEGFGEPGKKARRSFLLPIFMGISVKKVKKTRAARYETEKKGERFFACGKAENSAAKFI